MTRSQFIFSLSSGSAAMMAGYLLAQAGIADWGLFWVGSAIAALATFTAAKEHVSVSRWHVRRLAPVPVEH